MTLKTNKQPYFDDFNKAKNFVSVLFKPSLPVQTRELNQIQSIQHNQLEQFADHVFKHGARVNGTAPTWKYAPYVTLDVVSPWDGNPIDHKRLLGKKLRGQASQIEATLIKSVPMAGEDPDTMYVLYTTTAIDQKTQVFLNGEVIEVVDKNDIVTYSVKVRCPACVGANDARPELAPTGKGVLWTIPDSTYYANGYFVDIASEIVVGEKYSTDKESYTVGFDVVEDIVTAEDDASLYDNALGYPNYAADGADRARIRLIAAVRSKDYTDGDKFVTLASVEKGVVQYIRAKTDYSTIMEMIAERTYDESGNYTVVPFRVKFMEHLKKSPSDPNGFFLADEGGNENYLVGVVSQGKAYVKGYQVERIAESLVFFEKARDTKKIRDFHNRVGSMSYILVDLHPNSCFSPNTTSGTSVFTNETVNLYDGEVSGGLPTGSVIGKMKVFDVEYDSTDSNGIDRYKLYFADIAMNAGKSYEQVKSLYRAGSVLFSASPVADDLTGKPKIFNSGACSLLWDLGRDHIKSLRDADNPTVSSLNYTTRRKFFATLDSAGTYTWNASTDEYYDAIHPQTTICGVLGENGKFEKVSVSEGKLSVTPTQIKIDMGSGYAGKGFLLFHNVMKTGVFEKTKTLVRTTDSDIQIQNNTLTLSKADLYKIKAVRVYNPTAPDQKTDVTQHFTWTMGQNDYAYVPIVLTRNAGAPDWSALMRFEVEFVYYEHGTGDFFTVDSYTNIVDDPLLDYGYADIPSYKATNGVTYNLRSTLDFRPLALTSASIDTKQAALGAIYKSDVEYYLPRIDLITIDKEGNIYQKKGVASESPAPPKVEPGGGEMAIYQISMKPFVYIITRDVNMKFIENKRYTMRDIGKLEERIANVEYYTTFTMMEMQTADLKVKDANGLDRFKNGFVADNFLNYQASDLGSNEFKAALDRKSAELRPSYTMQSTELEIDEAKTTNAKILGGVAMIDYDVEPWQNQPYATKHLSVNPYYIFEKKGNMILSPNHDNWADTTREPNLVVEIDTGVDTIEKIAQKTGLLGTEWGAWKTINSTVLGSSTSSSKWASTYSGGTITSTATTIKTDMERYGTETTFESRTTSYDLGDRVVDVNIIPYMRSQEIEFHAVGLKANTRLYCFFDGNDVTADCRPLTTKSAFGDPLVTDSAGDVSGVFRIPTGRFFTGQKTFRLTSDAGDSRDPDLLTTSAEAVYWAGGLDLTKQETTLNVITPAIVENEVYETQSTVNTIVSSRMSIDWTKPVPPPPPAPPRACSCNPPPSRDPVAQTFYTNESCFITDVDLWFHTVTEGDNIFVQIKNTENGYPGGTILGEARMAWNLVNADETARKATRVTFPYPIYVEADKEYAIIVGGNSPDTRLWVSVLGQEDVNNPGLIIDKQPSLGSLFKSQNNTTWTASQYEDLKFQLHRARFKYNDMTLALRNKPLKDEELLLNPFETELGSRRVRVHLKNHGAAVGDKTDFRVGEHTWLNVKVTKGQLAVGQTIATPTGSAIVKEVKTTQNNTADCLLSEIRGSFELGQTFNAQSMTPSLRDNYLVTNFTRKQYKFEPSNVVSGIINQEIDLDVNGIPVGELNDELTVIEVDSADSFIVETSTAANDTGYAGGQVILNGNRRFEMFNVSGSFLPYESEHSWTLGGVGHKCNGLFDSSDYVRMQDKIFNLGEDTFLGQPYKLASSLNEARRLAGDASVVVTGKFKTANTLLSPVISVDTFSMIGVANRVEMLDKDAYNVEPNAIGKFIPETDPKSGSEIYKYVTRMVTLKNPALDMKILLDVYKPQDTDFDVYIKMLEPWENTEIDTKEWVLIENVWKDFISTNMSEFREVEINLSELMPGVFGSTEFSSFKVKIVGRAKNPANPPLFKMFRALAVT